MVAMSMDAWGRFEAGQALKGAPVPHHVRMSAALGRRNPGGRRRAGTGLDRLRVAFPDLDTAEDRRTFERLARDLEVASADDSTARGPVTLGFLDPGTSPGNDRCSSGHDPTCSPRPSTETTVYLCRRIIPACTRRTSAGLRDPGGTFSAAPGRQ